MVARRSDDGRYWFFFIVAARPAWAPGSCMPEHVFVLAAAILLCYWLALSPHQPVRQLQKAVERFGRGDLSARVNSVRRDELGQLARTFDRMADRIETLLDRRTPAAARYLARTALPSGAPGGRGGTGRGPATTSIPRSIAFRRNPTGSTPWLANCCR